MEQRPAGEASSTAAVATSAVSTFRIVAAALIVFVATFVLRVPSCYESFWIDELHSAWVVWESLSDVTPRATLGHQSPVYFVGLWFWKQVVGESEVALRLSSVLAVALGSATLTVGVARWSGSLLAGLVAGFCLATEPNSLFFGTELRPYALIILLSCIAVVAFLHLLGATSRHDRRGAWFGLNAAILAAILCQPTSIGLVLLPAILLVHWFVRDPREAIRFNLSETLIVLGAFAVGFALWNLTLSDTWQQKSAWATFASATEVRQIYSIWNWAWLWTAPLIVTTGGTIAGVALKRWRSIRPFCSAACLFALMAVVMTCTYWFVSWMNWVPVWHRRYFIAVLPMFACLAGAAVATAQTAFATSHVGRGLSIALAAAFMVAVPLQTRMIQRLPRYPVALVSRGEDWRTAMKWVRSNARPNDLIYLDAGLIENRVWLKSGLAVQLPIDQQKYLVYASLGPYSLNRRAIPFHSGGSITVQTGNPSRRIFMVLRRPIARVRKANPPLGTYLYDFGNVTVVVQSSELDQRILMNFGPKQESET